MNWVLNVVGGIDRKQIDGRRGRISIAADSAGIANVQKRLAIGVAVALGCHEPHIDGLKVDCERLLNEKQYCIRLT